MAVLVVRVVVRVTNMIVVEVLNQSVYLAIRIEVVVVFVRFYCCWLCGYWL